MRTFHDGHYLVMHPFVWHPKQVFEPGAPYSSDDPNDKHPGLTHVMHGGAHPTMFKTLRMATKAARDGYTWVKKKDPAQAQSGVILVFDSNLLPIVAPDSEISAVHGLADKLTDAEVAERQIMLWNQRWERFR